MRTKTGWVTMLTLSAVIATACTPGTTEDSEARTEQITTLETELSSARDTIAEQAASLDAAQTRIKAQASTLERLATREQNAMEVLETAMEQAERMAAETQALTSQTQQAIESIQNLVCARAERDFPDGDRAAFVDWLIETESDNGAVPDDLEVTIVDAAGRDGAWAFVAEFSTRFEPGVFSVNAQRNFTGLWGGMAPAESAIWDHLTDTYSDGEGALAACLDLSFFVES
ncbi:MAG: hypothetical protein ABFR53_07930 [Actinomycetota bacterium]